MPKTFRGTDAHNLRNVRAASHYSEVERRSVTFPDHTMSRGEAFGLEKNIKIIDLQKK